MNKIFQLIPSLGIAFLLNLLFFINCTAQTNNGVVKCFTNEMDSILRLQNPELGPRSDFDNWLDEAVQMANQSKVVGGVYQIPVVVHVIHSGEAVGTGTNVSFAAIQSQIDVLNEDFRKILGSNGWNNHPDGADTQIEFCLAQRRPNGTAFATGEPGVNRLLYSTITATAPPYNTAFIDATIKTWTYNGGVATATRGWDPNKYMNIWLCNISGGILGYAQFPQSPLGGMGCGTTATATDGVVFLYSSIGKSSITGFPGPYNEGRTATHEIGHWLGLRHIWGDGGCNVDDFCNDTPLAGAPNYGCPSGTNSCTAAPDAGPDMIENYMDYTDDLCMNIFTNDQKQRMRVVLENSPLRKLLINSDACTPPNTNDASVTDVFNPKGDNCNGSIVPSVQLRNRGSSNLTSTTILYSIDNGATTTFNWTGTLAPNASATITLPAFTTTLGTHLFKAYSTLPNGVLDPYTLYDTSSVQFVVSNGEMPNYLEGFDGQVFPPDLRWTVENVNADCYQWSPASGVSAAGFFSNNIAQLPFYGNSSASNEHLYTPYFILPCNATSSQLQFDVAYRQRVSGSNDRLVVEISQDCGATWTATTYDKQGAVLATNATLTGSVSYYPQVATDWRTETVSLQSYVTSTSKSIRIRFRGISNNGNNVYIDNVRYTAVLPAEAELSAGGTDVLDGGYYNFGNVLVGSTQNTLFTIQNTGTSTLNLSAPITISGAGIALVSSFTTLSVAPGGSASFTISFSPSSAGAFNGTVSFGTNDCDEGTYNFVLNGTGTTIPPTADFSASPLSTCVGNNVNFTNLSTYASSYLWNFGASATPSTSTSTNPTVVFNSPGTYPVSLTSTNAFGSDTETKTGYITILAVGSLPVSEGFTSAVFPPANWTVVNNNSSSTWVRSATIGVAPTAGNSMLFDNFNINDSDDDEVRMNPLSFVGYSNLQLQFSVAYAPYNTTNFDGLEVLISTNCGATFTSIYNKSNTVLATAAATTTTFTPTSTQWRTETINLNSYAGQGGVIIAFKNLSGYGNRLFIDNINLTGTVNTTSAFTASPLNQCTGQTVLFTDASINASSWSWNFGAGATPASATGVGPHSVTYSTAGTKSVTLTINGTTSSTQNITIVNQPTTPTITAGGPTTFCSGGSVTLTSSSATGNTWSNGATTQAITVSASGTYSVTVSNGTCSSTSTGTTVTVNTLPSTPTITAGGPTTFCSGGSVTLTSSSATGNTWSNGATTQAITVFDNGNYAFQVVDALGCSNSSDTLTVIVNLNPIVNFGSIGDLCIYSSPVLLSTGAPIGGVYNGSGVTFGSFNPNLAGLGIIELTYEYTDQNGCIGSDTITVLVDECASIDEEIVDLINIYPNPASDQISVNWNGVASSFSIYDEFGRVIYNFIPNQNQKSIIFELSNISSGVYNVVLELNSKKIQRQFVVNK